MKSENPNRRSAATTRFTLILIVGMGMTAADSVWAQVTADVTLEGDLGTIVGPNGGTNYEISGGTIVNGENQFHSFSQFDLPNIADIADFTGPAGIQNIISRITGGQSDINGTIRSSIAGADIWLINPNGVVFESGSSLDISGSFHVSTADYLLLGGGGQFFADPTEVFAPVLLVGNPTTFGFLQAPSTTDDIIFDNATLAVDAGETMSFVAQEVRLEGGSGSHLLAPGGRLNIASVGSAGTVTLLQNGLDTSGIIYDGTERVRMTNDSSLDVSGVGGGSIFIRGGTFQMGSDPDDDERVLANTTGSTDGGVIDIDVLGVAQLRGEISADTSGIANGGDISIVADQIGFGTRGPSGSQGGTDIHAISSGPASGNAGSISLAATLVALNNRATIRVETEGSGDAGDIDITVTGSLNIEADDGANAISSSTSGTGAGGNINILADTVTFQNGGISSTTSFIGNGAGDAGNITIRAGDEIRNTGTFILSTDSTGSGAGGNITLDADRLIDLTAGIITASTSSIGQGGSVTLAAPQIDLRRDPALQAIGLSSVTTGPGAAGRILVAGDTINIRDGASVAASTTGTGDAGDVMIDATTLFDLNGSTIASSSTGSASGAAGSIAITAGTVNVNSGGQLSVTTASNVADNEVGSITISGANEISISETAAILADTLGASDGGNVSLTAPTISIDNASLSVVTRGAGNSGNIAITATDAFNLSSGNVSSNSENSDSGAAGSIDVNARVVNVTSGSGLLADTASDRTENEVGSITITAADEIFISGNVFIDAETSGASNGGNVSLTAPRISVGDATLLRATTSGVGSAGDIIVDADDTFELTEATMAADSFHGDPGVALGAAGSIHINAGTVDINSGANIRAKTDSNNPDNRVGSITITAAEEIIVRDESFIDSGTSTPSASNGGDVSLTAPRVTVANADVRTSTGGVGKAGNIVIVAEDTFELTDSAFMGSDSFNGSPGGELGAAGSINISAGTIKVNSGSLMSARTYSDIAGNAVASISLTGSDEIVITGTALILAETLGANDGGDVLLDAPTISIDNASVSAVTRGSGDAGEISIIATDTFSLSGGSVSSNSIDSDSGAAGSISVNASSVIVTSGSVLVADTASDNTDNDVGSITIDGSETIIVSDTAFVSAGTSGASDGGNVSLTAPTVSVANANVRASTDGAGTGGSIIVESNVLTIESNALIAVNASGSGDAGSITLDASDTFNMTGSSIQSRSENSDGGDIQLVADELIFMSDSDVTTSAAGNAGSIQLGRNGDPNSPVFLIIQDNTVQANAGAAGGAIDIFAEYVLGSRNVIEALSDTGNDGEIIFDVPATDFVSVIAQLDIPFMNIAELLDDQCAQSVIRDRSSFIIDSAGLAPSPDSFAPSSYYLPPLERGSVTARNILPGSKISNSVFRLAGGC